MKISKSLQILAFVLLILGIIIALVPQNRTRPFKLSPESMLSEINSGGHFIAPEVVADQIINKDPSLQLVDVRTPLEFDNYSLPNAINIPLHSILDEQYVPLLDQEAKTLIFYSNGTTDALQAWMLTRQLGYNNVFVLQGGLNYWFEKVLNPIPPANIASNDEIAKYDFRKAIASALGGGALPVTNTVNSNTSAPKVPAAPNKKKKVQGGC